MLFWNKIKEINIILLKTQMKWMSIIKIKSECLFKTYWENKCYFIRIEDMCIYILEIRGSK